MNAPAWPSARLPLLVCCLFAASSDLLLDSECDCFLRVCDVNLLQLMTHLLAQSGELDGESGGWGALLGMQRPLHLLFSGREGRLQRGGRLGLLLQLARLR